MKDVMSMPNGVLVRDKKTGILYETGEFLNDWSRIARSKHYVGMWVIIRDNNQHDFEVID